MLFLEKSFAQMFIPAFTKGDKAFLATLPGVEIFDNAEGRKTGKNLNISNGIATINILSLLGDGLPDWISHTSYQSIIEAVSIADADPAVEKIVYIADGPGGYVSGWMPAALAIRDSKKPSVAIVGNMAASATYMLISQADEIIARDNLSTIGSIGVAAEYWDMTKFFSDMGVDIHTFTNDESKDKRPDLSTAEGRQIIQDGINDVYHEIETMIASGRGVSIEFLRENFGAGRTMLAKDALSAKMIESIKQKDLLLNDIDEEEIQETDKMDEIKTIQQLEAAYPSFCDKIAADAAEEAAKKGFEDGVASEKKRTGEWASFIDVEPEAVAAGIKGSDSMDSVTMAQFAAKQLVAENLNNASAEDEDEVDTPDDEEVLTPEQEHEAKLRTAMNLETK